MADGTGLVVNVRADDQIPPQNAEAFEVTARACDSVGWQYRRVGALDAVLVANVRWWSGYRHPRCLHLERAAELREVFATPTALMEGALAVGDPIGVAGAVPPDVVPGTDCGFDGGANVSRDGGPGGRIVKVSRPIVLSVDDEVRVGGRTHTVAGLSGAQVRLVDGKMAIIRSEVCATDEASQRTDSRGHRQ